MNPPNSEFTTKASGTHEVSTTGATRDNREGKGRFDLIPFHALQRVAQVYERGGKIRGDRNWEKGIPLSRFLDSALRHTYQLNDGQTDEDHAAQAIWNLLGFIQTQKWIKDGRLPATLNDLPTNETIATE